MWSTPFQAGGSRCKRPKPRPAPSRALVGGQRLAGRPAMPLPSSSPKGAALCGRWGRVTHPQSCLQLGAQRHGRRPGAPARCNPPAVRARPSSSSARVLILRSPRLVGWLQLRGWGCAPGCAAPQMLALIVSVVGRACRGRTQVGGGCQARHRGAAAAAAYRLQPGALPTAPAPSQHGFLLQNHLERRAQAWQGRSRLRGWLEGAPGSARSVHRSATLPSLRLALLPSQPANLNPAPAHSLSTRPDHTEKAAAARPDAALQGDARVAPTAPA